MSVNIPNNYSIASSVPTMLKLYIFNNLLSIINLYYSIQLVVRTELVLVIAVLRLISSYHCLQDRNLSCMNDI